MATPLQPFGPKLRANTTWEWTIPALTVGDSTYSSSDGYTLKYFLRGAQKLDLLGVSDGVGGWTITATDEQTKGLTAGWYGFLALVEKDGKKFEVGAGGFDVLPDLESAAAGYDGRSMNKKILDYLDAAIAGLAPRLDAEMELFDRRLRTNDITVKAKMRNEYAILVRHEQEDAGIVQPRNNQITVRMG